MGDSLSAAYNIAIEQSWPALFQSKLDQQHPGYQVINASISGETSAGGISRLPALLDKHQPTHMILELGGNDGLRGYRFEQTRNNLQDMIRMALDRQIQVLFIGVRMPPNLGPLYNQRFQQIFDELASDNDVGYLPRFLEGVAADKPEYMMDDGIHPTALAQPILAERVFRVFREHFIDGGNDQYKPS